FVARGGPAAVFVRKRGALVVGTGVAGGDVDRIGTPGRICQHVRPPADAHRGDTQLALVRGYRLRLRHGVTLTATTPRQSPGRPRGECARRSPTPPRGPARRRSIRPRRSPERPPPWRSPARGPPRAPARLHVQHRAAAPGRPAPRSGAGLRPRTPPW